MPARLGPVLMVGAGQMGGALIEGWRKTGVLAPTDLMILDPAPGEAARAAAREGARLNPSLGELAAARSVVLAVKPQAWRTAVDEIAAFLAPSAAVVSIMAGVETSALSPALGGRPVARVMPTTAAAIAAAAVSLFCLDPGVRDIAQALFGPLGTLVALESEDQMHAATAVSGSGPAYLYALIEALQSAGVGAGLTAEASERLAAATITGAAALMAASSQTAAELRRQVTSPGGTTEAALKVLLGDDGLPRLLDAAVAAAAARSRELGRA